MLFLLPNLLSAHAETAVFLPSSVDEAMQKIDGLIAESESGGRAYLKRFQTKKKPHLMPIALLGKDTSATYLDFLLEPVQKGEIWGVVSDAGLACLADPGAQLVFRAKEKKITIKAFVGPSSITLALVQSGLSGQAFFFRGYIAKEPEVKRKELVIWETESKRARATQIFIEAPYRNAHTFQTCLEVLSPGTFLAVATDLTGPEEKIITLDINEWRKRPSPEIEKKPTIFLFIKK